jgi:hypothetical protein
MKQLFLFGYSQALLSQHEYGGLCNGIKYIYKQQDDIFCRLKFHDVKAAKGTYGVAGLSA